MQRTANAKWQGGLKTGSGELTTQSGVLKATPYSFSRRFESTPGTNPEELIGAASAGCFTMALANMLEQKGFPAQSLETQATVGLNKVNDKMTLDTIHLVLHGRVPKVDPKVFQETAEEARKTCIVSRALAGVKITLDAKVEGATATVAGRN